MFGRGCTVPRLHQVPQVCGFRRVCVKGEEKHGRATFVCTFGRQKKMYVSKSLQRMQTPQKEHNEWDSQSLSWGNYKQMHSQVCLTELPCHSYRTSNPSDMSARGGERIISPKDSVSGIWASSTKRCARVWLFACPVATQIYMGLM